MLLEQLRDEWFARLRSGPIDAVPRFAEQGMVLGAGTVLLACAGGRQLQQVKGQEARLLALLSAACGEVLPRKVAGGFERAAKCWSEGDDCLAYIHLAHARLPAPRDVFASACRLLAAEIAIGAGVAPQSVLQALQAPHADLDPLEKFDPNQPRVPAGSGRTRGQWTDGGATGAGVSADEQKPQGQPQGSSAVARMPTPPASFLGELGASQLAELGLFAARLLGPAAAAAAAFELLFIPSQNDVHVEGEVAGVPGLRYSWNQDEALLHFTYDTGDGEQRTFAAYANGDKFFDEQGRVIGRVLPDGGILIKSAVASPDLAKDGEPRLCPAPGPDKPNERGREYEDYAKPFVNPPPATTLSGMGFQLPNPEDAGKLVYYDDCRLTTGMLAEFKGPGYDGLLAASEQGVVPEWSRVVWEWWDESGRQIAASDGRPVRWYFADLAVAQFARKLFDSDNEDGRQRNRGRVSALVEEGAVMDEGAFDYSIRATRIVHVESPSAIGERVVRTLDALSKIDPAVFTNWEIMDLPAKSSVPLAAARSRIGAMIANNISRDDWGEPAPYYGYSAMAHTGNVPTPRLIRLWIKAGGKHPGHIWLQTGFWRVPADPSIVTFPIFKGALLALVAEWQLPWISAHAFRSNTAMVPVHGGAGYMLESRPMLPQEPTFPRSPFEIPWIGYLSPALSNGVKLSPEIVTERTPDGGLLMIATEDRLDPANREHLRRARIIAETMIACTGCQAGDTVQAR